MAMNNRGGRPSKLNTDVIQKLADHLRLGLTVQESCIEAGISTSTYYTYKVENEGFSDKMESARNYVKLKAKAVVMKAIEGGDLATSRWFLQKYDQAEAAGINNDTNNSLDNHQLLVLNEAVSDLRAGIIRKENNKIRRQELRN